MIKNLNANDAVLVDLADGKAAPAGALPQLHAQGYVTANGKLTDRGRERARKVKQSGADVQALARGVHGAGTPGLCAVAPKFTS